MTGASDMGMIVEFPADAAIRRRVPMAAIPALADKGTVLILPVVRIERHEPDTATAGDGREPNEGAPPRRRRKRRAR